MYTCENCGIDFEDWRTEKVKKYNGPPKHCSRKCQQLSAAKRGGKATEGRIPYNKGMKGEKLKQYSSFKRGRPPKSIMEVSSRTASKIIKRMKIPCSKCGWYVEGVVGDLHHIVEKKNGGTDDMSNLTYICPNCHRLVHSGIIKPEELKPMSETAPLWEEYYHGYVVLTVGFNSLIPHSC